MSPLPSLQARNLGRRIGRHWIVRDISLELRPGDVLGLLGPNGAGKTTTLQMLAGLRAPGAGQVQVAGQDLYVAPPQVRAALGYLPDIPPLYPELSCEEFLRCCVHLRGLQNPDERISRTLARCGLTAVRRQRIGTLSKGYQQRLGLAQAIVHDPSVVILDEPTVGLDPRQLADVRTLLGELAQQQAVILSTHQLGEVAASCNRVLILQGGRDCYQGRLTPNGDVAALESLYLDRTQP